LYTKLGGENPSRAAFFNRTLRHAFCSHRAKIAAPRERILHAALVPRSEPQGWLSQREDVMTPGRACASAALFAVARVIAAQPDLATDKWEELGCQKVGFLIDRDVVKVGRREGRFKVIRLEVSGNAVYMEDLKVVYGNGAPDDIPVRSEIRDGGQ